MPTTTINITLPKQMKATLDEKVKNGLYTSISELIREAVRDLITRQSVQATQFSAQAQDEIRTELKEARKHPDPLASFDTSTKLEDYLDSLE